MVAKFDAHNVSWAVEFFDESDPKGLYIVRGYDMIPVSWDMIDALCDHPTNIRGIVYPSKRREFDDAMYCAMAEESRTYGKEDAMDDAKERMHD